MAQARALTATQVNALTKEGVHWVAPSLYMQVTDHGTRSWLFRYSRNGTNQWMGLGSTEDKPLSAIVIEQVYRLQGVGALAVQAVASLDRPIIIGVVLLGGFVIVVANIVVDIVYVLLDPRVR